MSNKKKHFLAILLAIVMIINSVMLPSHSSYATTAKLKVVTKVRSVAVNETIKIKANMPVTFKSQNKEIATVSSKGVVKGKAPGKVKILLTSKKDSKKQARVTITVNKKLVLRKPTGSKIILCVGNAYQIKTNVAAKYKSSKPTVATVTPKGLVKAKKRGTAKITVISKKYKKKKSFKVIVKDETVTTEDSATTEATTATTEEQITTTEQVTTEDITTTATEADASDYDDPIEDVPTEDITIEELTTEDTTEEDTTGEDTTEEGTTEVGSTESTTEEVTTEEITTEEVTTEEITTEEVTTEEPSICVHLWQPTGESAQADCVTDGYVVYACTKCGEKKTESISATGHTFTVEDTTSDYLYRQATCDSPALYCYKCIDCGSKANASFTYEVGKALGHEYSVKQSTPAYLVNEATCSSPAIYRYKCCRCSAASEETYEHGNKTGHNFTSKEVSDAYKRSEATCTKKATYWYKCADCDEVSTDYYEYGSEVMHAWVEDVQDKYRRTLATCEDTDTYYYSCAHCGIKSTSYFNYGDALGHDFSVQSRADNYLRVQATCQREGSYYYKCARCEEAATSYWISPKVAHLYVANSTAEHALTPVTCTVDGEYKYSCEFCGVENDKTYTVDALGHDFTEECEDELYFKEIGTNGYITSICMLPRVYYLKCTRCAEHGTDVWQTATGPGHEPLDKYYICPVCKEFTGAFETFEALTDNKINSYVIKENGAYALYIYPTDGRVRATIGSGAGGYDLKTIIRRAENQSKKEITKVVFGPTYTADGSKNHIKIMGDIGWTLYQTSVKEIDLAELDTSTATAIYFDSSNITALDMTGLDTSKIITMSRLASYCDDLQSVKMSNIDTSNVTNMESMFAGCNNLTSIDMSGCSDASITNAENMFNFTLAEGKVCEIKLTGFNFEGYNVNAMFEGCPKANITVSESCRDKLSAVQNDNITFIYE